MSISQNAILAKCQSPKSLLLLHFLMNLPETCRIDVNIWISQMSGFLVLFFKNFEPKKKQKSFFLNFGLKIFFEDLNQKPRTKLFAKSIFTYILKILDKFIKKCRRSRDFGD